jgi:glycolate oxidase FAD binding subunit
MIPPAARRALEAALGGEGCAEHEPELVEGFSIDTTLRPAGFEGLAAALRGLGEYGLAALVRGGGTLLACGNRPRRADVLLDMRGLAGVSLLDAEEGVALVAAGTPLAALSARAREAGFEPPLDPPGEQATLGGALASAAVGPRYPRPRDAVLGLEVALATGERTRCGGRVVKNVTGYDLMKLHTGAFGSLGVIASAWLRLRPLPEHVALCAAPLALEDRGGFEAARDAARLATARATALLDAEGARAAAPGLAGKGALLVVELAGAAAAVEQDAARLAQTAGAAAAPGALLERVRAAQGEPEAGAGLRLRVAYRSARLEAAWREAAAGGLRLLAYPGCGLLFARRPLDAERRERAEVETALEAGRRAARAGGGALRLESAPLWAREGRDVFEPNAALLPLYRALKVRFDPGGVLNPGRFAGGL